MVDRSAWHQCLATELVDSSKYLLLHGHRQSGKSSAGRAVNIMLSSRDDVVAIPLVIGTMRMDSLEEFWSNLNAAIRLALRNKREWYSQQQPRIAALLDELTGLDIVDNQTFKHFFEAHRWSGRRVEIGRASCRERVL